MSWNWACDSFGETCSSAICVKWWLESWIIWNHNLTHKYLSRIMQFIIMILADCHGIHPCSQCTCANGWCALIDLDTTAVDDHAIETGLAVESLDQWIMFELFSSLAKISSWQLSSTNKIFILRFRFHKRARWVLARGGRRLAGKNKLQIAFEKALAVQDDPVALEAAWSECVAIAPNNASVLGNRGAARLRLKRCLCPRPIHRSTQECGIVLIYVTLGA